MNTIHSTRLMLTTLVVVCALLAAPATAASIDHTAANATSIQSQDSFVIESDGQTGDQVTVTLSTTASNVAGYQANVTFDPDVLEVSSVDGIDFDDPVANVQNDDGWVFLTQSQTDGVAEPTVASITFTIESSATTAVTFVDDDSSINDDQGEQIDPATEGVELDVTDDGGDGDDGDDGNDGGDGDEGDGGDDGNGDDGSDGGDGDDENNADDGNDAGDGSDDGDGTDDGNDGDSDDGSAGDDDDGDGSDDETKDTADEGSEGVDNSSGETSNESDSGSDGGESDNGTSGDSNDDSSADGSSDGNSSEDGSSDDDGSSDSTDDENANDDNGSDDDSSDDGNTDSDGPSNSKSSSDDEENTADGTVPGFTFGTAILGALILGLLVVRRRI